MRINRVSPSACIYKYEYEQRKTKYNAKQIPVKAYYARRSGCCAVCACIRGIFFHSHYAGSRTFGQRHHRRRGRGQQPLFGGAVGLGFLPISAPAATQKMPTVPQPNPQGLSVPVVGGRCHFPVQWCGLALLFLSTPLLGRLSVSSPPYFWGCGRGPFVFCVLALS